MNTDEGSLQALLSLLETESEESVRLLVEQMRGFTDAQLRRLADLAPPISRALPRINLLLAEREAPRIQALFLEWAAAGEDVEDGILLVARTGYPRLDTGAVRRQLDAMADEIRARLPVADRVRQLKTLVHEIHNTYRFRGNTSDYYDPENNYLHRVIDRRTGLPITLSVVYTLLGKRLDLPIVGVPLPGHFIAALQSPGVNVYFDPFRSGTILSPRDVMGIVTSTGLSFHPDHLLPATSAQIVQRLLANLLHAFEGRDEMERAELVRRYLSVL